MATQKGEEVVMSILNPQDVLALLGLALQVVELALSIYEKLNQAGLI